VFFLFVLSHLRGSQGRPVKVVGIQRPNGSVFCFNGDNSDNSNTPQRKEKSAT
jgi:hypothetical protein